MHINPINAFIFMFETANLATVKIQSDNIKEPWMSSVSYLDRFAGTFLLGDIH